MHGANIQDRDGAKGVLKRSRSRFPFVELAYVDGGYAGRLVRWAKDRTHIVLEVVKRSAEQVGFAVIQRRWVVERTFAWIIKNRRFVRDYEQLTAVAETNPHHHRCRRNPHPAMAVTSEVLLKRALK